jgi:hypothetical protein
MKQTVKYILVEFPSRYQEFKGFKEMMYAGTGVRHIQDRKYVITKPQFSLLKSRNVKFKKLKQV